MRIAFDVDDVLAKGGHPYSECEPFPGVIEYLKELRKNGHTIIIHTSRYMEFYEGNIEKARNRCWGELKRWLDKWGFEYDEIYGAPKVRADIFVDDRAFNLQSERGDSEWTKLMDIVKKSENKDVRECL